MSTIELIEPTMEELAQLTEDPVPSILAVSCPCSHTTFWADAFNYTQPAELPFDFQDHLADCDLGPACEEDVFLRFVFSNFMLRAGPAAISYEDFVTDAISTITDACLKTQIALNMILEIENGTKAAFHQAIPWKQICVDDISHDWDLVAEHDAYLDICAPLECEYIQVSGLWDAFLAALAQWGAISGGLLSLANVLYARSLAKRPQDQAEPKSEQGGETTSNKAEAKSDNAAETGVILEMSPTAQTQEQTQASTTTGKQEADEGDTSVDTAEKKTDRDDANSSVKSSARKANKKRRSVKNRSSITRDRNRSVSSSRNGRDRERDRDKDRARRSRDKDRDRRGRDRNRDKQR